MNKKGYTNITLIFWTIGFIVVWGMFAAPIIGEWGQQAVINGGYTGFIALFYGYLNVFIGFVFLAALLFVALSGGGQQ